MCGTMGTSSSSSRRRTSFPTRTEYASQHSWLQNVVFWPLPDVLSRSMGTLGAGLRQYVHRTTVVGVCNGCLFLGGVSRAGH